MKQEVYSIFCQDLNYWDMIKIFNARIMKIYKFLLLWSEFSSNERYIVKISILVSKKDSNLAFNVFVHFVGCRRFTINKLSVNASFIHIKLTLNFFDGGHNFWAYWKWIECFYFLFDTQSITKCEHAYVIWKIIHILNKHFYPKSFVIPKLFLLAILVLINGPHASR